ncbi:MULTISPECIES: PLP-dependent aminotransferase family protein [unclassified Micromonospora]|uniref:MocR-like pyridoxine biosynthesis transcription factor PdxR n=1 Tax=unclassified Micromonospora TaxID=2617518 RepID=UPI001B37DAAC|nr:MULTISPECIES: PLP-dependent aminotransferase family protein [unclassified Micromonospora]MBQ0978001.1 PLP-dependent aminotransferase family protein [Micromonospora sp. M61]MBQ1037283.1 PLP-dependent aminotransferase family protein [Micromonospora sp. C81]
MSSSQLLVALDRASSVPLQQQLCDQISGSVRTGRLRPGDPVPPSRELAHQLRVSRTVVTRAYELLRANGVLTSRRGSGTRVSDALADTPPPAKRAATHAHLWPEPPLATDAGSPLWKPWEPAPMHRPDGTYDFRHGTPALASFPVTRWRQSLTEAVSRADAVALGYGPAEGSPTLRAQISALLRRSRALDAPREHTVVTSGATQAMDILVRLLVGPDDVVIIEDPSHTVLRQIFGYSRAAVVPVAVDEEGLRVDDIDSQVRAHGLDPARVRLIYVTPSHQFPTGFIMSERRRRALLRWAREHAATVLEDDYHNEFTFAEERLPSLAADPQDADVVYVGSFSKTLFPSLRIGYAVLPPHLVRPFLGVKWITDRLTATLTQEALAEFISSGAYARHIGRMDRLYRQRRARLLEALYEHFGAGVRISGTAAGLHVLVTLGGAPDADEAAIVRAAAARGVRIYPASGYFVTLSPAEPTFLIGYAALPTARITEGVALLAAAVREVTAR